MKHNYIMLRIIMMFTVVILFSFVPEMNRKFFGDWTCQGSTRAMDNHGTYQRVGCDQYSIDNPGHTPTWHWGFRHYMWSLMGLILFVYNTVLIIGKVNE